LDDPQKYLQLISQECWEFIESILPESIPLKCSSINFPCPECLEESEKKQKSNREKIEVRNKIRSEVPHLLKIIPKKTNLTFFTNEYGKYFALPYDWCIDLKKIC